METDRMFHALVLGGTLLATGCGGKMEAVSTDSGTILCCPEECFNEPCACASGSCCWLVSPDDEPGCAAECAPEQ